MAVPRGVYVFAYQSGDRHRTVGTAGKEHHVADTELIACGGHESQRTPPDWKGSDGCSLVVAVTGAAFDVATKSV